MVDRCFSTHTFETTETIGLSQCFFFRNVCHSLRSIGPQLLLSTTACSGQPSAGACFSKAPKSFWNPESHNKTSSQTLSPQSCSFLIFLISTKFPFMQSSMPIHTTLVLKNIQLKMASQARNLFGAFEKRVDCE